MDMTDALAFVSMVNKKLQYLSFTAQNNQNAWHQEISQKSQEKSL